MNKLLFLPLFALAACNTTRDAEPEPRIVTVEVPVPVAQPCVPHQVDVNPPAYPDTDEALRIARDAAERYQLLWAGRAERNARLGVLEPVVRACPREPVPAPAPTE